MGKLEQQHINEWKIVYHEILTISDCFIQMTSYKIAIWKRDLHHDLSGGIAKEFQKSVNKIYNFIESHGNPYKARKNGKLHHFININVIQAEIASKLLNVYKTGCEKYDQFQKERFIVKEKPFE